MAEFIDMIEKHMTLPPTLDLLAKTMLYNDAEASKELRCRLNQEFKPFDHSGCEPYAKWETSHEMPRVPESNDFALSRQVQRNMEMSVQAMLDRHIHLLLSGFTVAKESDIDTFASTTTEAGAFTIEEMNRLIQELTNPPQKDCAECMMSKYALWGTSIIKSNPIFITVLA